MAQINSNLQIKMYWGDILYDSTVCQSNEEITIGRGADNTFILDPQQTIEQNNISFKLVQTSGGKSADIFFSDQYHGHIRKNGELVSLQTAIHENKVTKKENGSYATQLGEKDQAEIVIGHVSFSLEWVEDGEKIPYVSVLNKKNWWIPVVFGVVLFAVSFFIYFAGEIEEEIPPERLITLEAPKVPRAKSMTPSTQAASKAAIGEKKSADGGAEKGPLGKAEVKVPEQNSAVQTLRKSNLGSLVSSLPSAGANAPHQKTDSSEGAVGPQAQVGTGGFSTEGLKKGGGGQSVGIGRTVGQGEGGFGGTGRLGLAGNSSVDGAGAGGGGQPIVAGGLDREVIESYIRRRLDRIKLCYERQLNFFPKLSGKISVHFVIGKTGQVLQNKIIEDSLKNESVRKCILAEVATWNFPQPEGGTLVNVDYPFVFESSAKGP